MKKSLILFCITISIVGIAVLLRSCNQGLIEYKRVSKNRNSREREVKGRIILALGDSNGKVNGGWPAALQAILREDIVLNNSEGGRTIGFDNCGNPKWNALKNIEAYLNWGLQCSNQNPLDEVIILLGTNDSKACFDNLKDEVTPNLIRLIAKIRSFNNSDNPSPHITIVTPPPYAPDSIVPKKALGGDERVRLLINKFRDVALKYDCGCVNIYYLIKSVFHAVVYDHVHLTRKGHSIVAKAIAKVINDRNPPEPPSNLVCRNNTLFWQPSPSSDVIGYEVINGDKIINAVAATEYKFHPEVSDVAVRARDGYGNVSIMIRP